MQTEVVTITTHTLLLGVVIGLSQSTSMFLVAHQQPKLSYTVFFSYKRRSTGVRTFFTGGPSEVHSAYGNRISSVFAVPAYVGRVVVRLAYFLLNDFCMLRYVLSWLIVVFVKRWD